MMHQWLHRPFRTDETVAEQNCQVWCLEAGKGCHSFRSLIVLVDTSACCFKSLCGWLLGNISTISGWNFWSWNSRICVLEKSLNFWFGIYYEPRLCKILRLTAGLETDGQYIAGMSYVTLCITVGSERVQLSLHGCKNVPLLVGTHAVCVWIHLSVVSY